MDSTTNPPPPNDPQPPVTENTRAPGPFQIAAPSAVVTITSESATLDVSWTASDDAVDYVVTLGAGAECSPAVQEQTLTTTSASFANVPVASYFLCVRAQNAAGVTDATNQPYNVTIVRTDAPPTTKGNGLSCASDIECGSGHCSDGVCCESACSGVCSSCIGVDTGGADGACLPVSQGTDPADECAPAGCAPGSCNGSRACSIEPNTTECRAPEGACDAAEYCDGTHIECGADVFLNEGTECGDYLCAGGVAACPTGCTTDSECATDRFCSGGACLLGKRVFVTSSTHNGSLGGQSGADTVCQNLAMAANLGGQYKAFLSTSTVAAGTRMTQATIPYRTVTGTIIADDWTDLLDGTLDAQPTVTESGATIATIFGVWTGTNETGNLSTMSTTNCSDWTTAVNTQSGVSGFANNAQWADFGVGQCNGTRRLYCFQD
jgi:hypothetical protein